MTGRSNLGAAAIVLAGALTMSACASKAPKQLPPEPVGVAQSTDTGPQGPVAGSQAGGQAAGRAGSQEPGQALGSISARGAWRP